MTDRLNGFIVVLEQPRREDDAEAIANAIRMIKGVIRVEPLVDDAGNAAIRWQESDKFRNRLYQVIKEFNS